MEPIERPGAAAGISPDDASVELSSRRTGMSFQRTRLSADRTLMSVIRTSLSLISAPARRFGSALVILGIVMLVLGIGYHVAFMAGLREERAALKGEGLVHAESRFPVSLTLIVASLLLLTGLFAIASMTLNAGPFG